MLNLVQLQERLKDVPLQALMQYANGANPQIPPFLALTEMNRRKKMQESAAADQAREMEGAPTVKQQIEQAAGLMALQGNRQRQAAQQQQSTQAAMPMAAPNTTTSEPAQLAGGGFIDDIVVPRDYAPGGSVIDPETLKRLMLREAMQGDVEDIPKELTSAVARAALRRRPGVAGVPLPTNMFRRSDYAGGGIVAFAGPQGSFVERGPGFYQLKEELPEDEEDKIDLASMSPEARMLMRGIKQLQQRATPEVIAARRQAMGLPTLASELPDTGAKTLEELQRQKQAFDESDTFANRLLSLTPGRRFGYGETGKGLMAYEKERAAKGSELGKAIASAQDLREKAKLDFAEGRFKESEVGMAAADKAALDAQKAMIEMQKGRELTNAAKTIFDEAQAAGAPITMEEAYRRATLATTRPPDRYTALSNRLIAANREFKDRAFFLEQQLQNAKTDAERAKIQKVIDNLRTEIMSSHSITPADLAELQRLDRSSGGAGGTSGGSSAGQSDPLGIRNR